MKRGYLLTTIIVISVLVVGLAYFFIAFAWDTRTRVQALETMHAQGYIAAPAYDSGWTAIERGEFKVLFHGLNTTDVFVYVVARDSSDPPNIHQMYYGGIMDSGGHYIGFR